MSDFINRFTAIILLLIVILCALCSCGKKKKLVSDIEKITNKQNITQEEIDDLFERYNNLSNEDQKGISNSNILMKYKNVDVDKVQKLKTQIQKNINSDNFETIGKIYDDYNLFSSNEQALIDIDEIKQKITPNDLEKSVIAACQYIKKSLKSSNSFKLLSAKAIDDTDGKSKYYLVYINYSATNGFGAETDEVSFQTINKDFINPWYALTIIKGDYAPALECTSYMSFYYNNSQSPTEINCQKILYNIDMIVN